jgi:hypothetical protein
MVRSGCRRRLGFLLSLYACRMYREKPGENPDLDHIGPARPGEHPTDERTVWTGTQLRRWSAASRRAFRRRREAARERVRRRSGR